MSIHSIHATSLTSTTRTRSSAIEAQSFEALDDRATDGPLTDRRSQRTALPSNRFDRPEEVGDRIAFLAQ
jgi:hypothetical protein